ncbi:MAG: hypothetical protein LBT80_08185 [Lactobacillaceae bacterium]|nr:hypothetical protein [Lactobacillaceae bacterium]
METTYIVKSGIDILQSCIGQKIKSITADDWDGFDRSYGAVLVEIGEQGIVIDNDYRTVKYLDSIEEFTGFTVIKLANLDEFEPSVLEENLKTQKLDDEILSIEIVRDVINVEWLLDRQAEHYIVDQAIIFKFAEYEWLLGLDSTITPMISMHFGKNVKAFIISTEDVISEWSDVENNDFNVTVERTVMNLS